MLHVRYLEKVRNSLSKLVAKDVTVTSESHGAGMVGVTEFGAEYEVEEISFNGCEPDGAIVEVTFKRTIRVD